MHHATQLRFPQLFSLAHKCKNGNGVASYKSWGRFSTQRKRHTIRAFSCKCMGASLLAQGQTIMQCARPHPRNFMRARPVVLSRRRRAAFMSRRDFPVRINIFATTHTHICVGFILQHALTVICSAGQQQQQGRKAIRSLTPNSLLISLPRPWRATPAHAAHIFFTQYICVWPRSSKRCVLRTPLPQSCSTLHLNHPYKNAIPRYSRNKFCT